MRPFTKLALATTCLLALAACAGPNGSVESEDAALSIEKVAGSYVSYEFTEPGSSDAGVDVAARGGVLSLLLRPDQRVEIELRVPERIGSNFDGLHWKDTGDWSLEGSRIRIDAPGFPLQGLEWTADGETVEGEQSTRFGGIHVALARPTR